MGFLDLAFGNRDYLSPEGEFDPAAYRRSRFGDAIGDLSAGLIAYGMGQPAQAAAAFGRMGRSDPTEPFKLSMMSAQAKKAQADAARTAASQQLMSNPQGLLALGLSQEQAQTIGLLGMIDPGKAAEALQKWVSPEKTYTGFETIRGPDGNLRTVRLDNRGGMIDVDTRGGVPVKVGEVSPTLLDPGLAETDRRNAGLRAGAVAAAEAPYKVVPIQAGGGFAIPFGGMPAGASAGGASSGGGGSFADRIVQYESAGDPNARNPRSSATGIGQFINSTWLDLIRRNRPDLAQGKTDAQILALRSDPQLSREMIGTYANENAGELRAAGLPDNDTNLALAHAFGSAGARKILSVVPSTPMTMAVPADVIRANPHLANMTTGQVIAQAQQRFGAGTAPAGGAPAATPGYTTAPLPTGGFVMQPTAPGGKEGSDLAAKQFDTMETLARVRQIEGSFDPRFLQLGNRWGNLVTAWKDRAGVGVSPAETAELRGYTQFRQNTAATNNQIINQLSGAAVSDAEAQRMRAALPTAGAGIFDGDSPSEFKAKLDNTLQSYRHAMMRYSFARANGLDPLKTGVDLSDVPQLVNRTGREIERQVRSANPGAADELIQAETQARLARLFGLG